VLNLCERPCRTPCSHEFCRACILEALQTLVSAQGDCPLCRAPLSLYSLRDAASGELLAEPPVSTIFGTVYVQQGGVGVASYHFDAAGDCYISYANAPESWTLDDGSRAPAKKPFSETSWDPASRTFRGVVHWDPPFDGSRRWDYEIVFAENFACIVGGKVVQDAGAGPVDISFAAPWSEDSRFSLSYLRWMPPPDTIYGSVYVQGASYRPQLEGLASYHFRSEGDCYICYGGAPPEWRLDDGSLPPSQKSFCNTSYDVESRTFKGTVEWETTWQDAARWEYEMVFSEDFGHIVGGQVLKFGLGGESLGGTRFTTNASEWGMLRYCRKPGALMDAPRIRAD